MKKTLLILLLCICGSSFAQNTLIYCGGMIDGVRNDVQKEMTVVVKGSKIIAVEKGYRKPDANDKIIDLKNRTVMPGFIDMHVHLENETRRGQEVARFTNSPIDVAFASTGFAKKTLMAGFTTVRDLGGSGVNIALRKAIASGLVIGPRVFTAGKSLSTTGGHADPTNGSYADLKADPGPINGVINSVEEARQAVRQRYKEGSDCIKITATGGVLSQAKDGMGPHWTEEEIRAVVETAKDYGFHVAAHAHGAEGMKRAIRAGVTTIEHGTFMDDEAMDLMKKMGAYYVPTIIAGKTVADSAKIFGYYSYVVTPKALAIGPKIQETFAKAYKAGVKIAFGTDAGVYVHGRNAKEFEYMVEAGMPAMEAIQSATVTNATILGMRELIGSIEVGRFADIVASTEDPIKNIKTLQDIKFVMKEGVVYKE